MKEEATCTYLANPESYCEHISTLIQNGTDEWQNLWQSAIKELFHNSEIFQNPVNNINAINSLLKVIEKAFKERVYRLRVQAFECWQYFIVTIDTCDVSDKLLNVLLIPLCASNHSIFEVLCAKLRTWATLLDSNLILRSTITKKGVPNLLKILYGPHALRQASEFDDLVEICGNIYLKMLEKCKAYETNDLIMGYLERAIPVLTKNENTQSIADLIWTNALEYISRNNWPASQFNYLIKTFQNLVSSNSTGCNALITSFLTVLIEIYGSFPVGYLKLNLALFIRCLFHVPEKNILNLMERLMKKCQNENLFFNEIIKTWHACVEEYKNELHKYWFAAKTCFLSWEKHEETPNSTWVLLLPVENLHTKWDAVILEDVRSTYDSILPLNNADSFLKTLCDDLTEFISESENLPLSLLISIIDLCKIVLQSPKRSDGVRHLKLVLMAVFHKIPSQDVLLSSTYKSFFPKFVAIVLYFMKEFPDCASEMSPITRICNSFINSNEKDSSELPVVQLIRKYNTDLEGNNETVLKPHNGVNVAPSAKTNNHIKTSFLARLTSSIEKKRINSETIAKVPSTPKSMKSPNKEDVQFIAIQPKPKNSPMTEHQKEVAKSKSYIPALYEDLSQSQSQSNSNSQSESISLLSNKVSAPIISGIDYFEEDANLPPEQSITCAEADNAPAAASVTKISTIHTTNLEKESILTSRKSLFKDKLSTEDAKNVCFDGSRNLRVNLQAADIPNDGSKNENPPLMKRRRARSMPVIEIVEPKRLKHVSENISDQSKNAPLEPKDTTEEKRKRGRPRKSEPINVPESQEVNIVETESQNLFVSNPSRLEKSSVVNSPLDSLMNVKNYEDRPKVRRKSLKSKNYELPARSPIATRKRKSSLIQNSDKKKPCDSTDEHANGNSCTSLNADEVEVSPVIDVDDAANNNAKNLSKHAANAEKVCNEVINLEDESSSELNNSVIIIESNSANEIISIIDSESQSAPKKPVDTKIPNLPKPPAVESSDESTFFEDAEVAKKPEHNGYPTKKANGRVDENAHKASETGKAKKITVTNDSLAEEPVSSKAPPQEAQACVEKCDQVANNSNAPADVAHKVPSQWNEAAAPEQSDKSPTKTVSSPTKHKNSPKTSPEKNECIPRKESPNSATKSSEKSATVNDLPDMLTVKKKLVDEMSERNEIQNANADQPKINTSPLSNNTRTFKIMKMACDSHNLSKHKHFGKMSKSPMSSSPGPSSSRITSTNQRTMKILMANNGSLEKSRSSPNQILPTTTERLKYYPKECTSPGILKKPDLNGSVSSPKSAKFVNFAEQLTATRTFDVYEENCYDSCSSDEASNSNIINDDEATSQEVLYSPLLNCSEDVKHIIDRLSLGKAAVDLFHRMGISTVGHLASISTLTAKSIPAGDNRLHRLRKALKDYDNCRTSFYESKGLRIPSARRRILCKSPKSILEISSLVELLDEAESMESSSTEATNSEVVQNSNNSSTNNNNNNVGTFNRLPTVVIAKLSEENCPSLLNKDEIIVRLEGQSSPIKATKAADGLKSSAKGDSRSLTTKNDPPRSPTKTDAPRSPTKVDTRSSPTKTDAPRSPTKVDARLSPTKTDVPRSPTKVDAPRLPTKTDAPRSPTKVDAPRSPTKTDAPRSPTKTDAPRSPTKTDSRSPPKTDPAMAASSSETSPLKESVATGEVAVDRVAASVCVSIPPTKSAPLSASDGEAAERESALVGVVDGSSTADEIAAEGVPEVATTDTTRGRTDEVATVPPVEKSTETEAGECGGDKTSDEHDISDDPDLIYTPTDERPVTKRGEPPVKRQHSMRAISCEYVTWTHSLLVDDEAAPSPEIITVDDDGAEHEEPEQAEENAGEKEGSMSIFSPDVTSRTVNREAEALSQSMMAEVSKTQQRPFEERSLFTNDETATPAAQSASGPSRGDGIFAQLLATLWEPFLTDRLRSALIPDERSAFVEYVAIMRRNVAKLREAREKGAVDADALEECGLIELVNEMSLLKE